MDRFAGIFNTNVSIFNFYSSTEDVLENGNAAATPTDAWITATTVGELAWNQQEVVKGTDWVTAWLAERVTPGVDVYGGWGINTVDHHDGLELGFDFTLLYPFINLTLNNRPLEPQAALNLNPDVLDTAPFFKHFKSEYEFLHSDSNISSISDDDISNIIAHAIPALSFAAGRNKLAQLPATNNIDMPTALRVNCWPEEAVGLSARWKHNDIKAVAYLYTYKVYLRMVEEGGLK